jgi:NAD+ kinase
MAELPQASGKRKPAFHLVGLLYHPKLAESRVMAAEIYEYVEGLGASVWVNSSWDGPTLQESVQKSDLLIVLGGDGSMLRAARMAAPHKIPVLTINMGRLGFLAEVRPAEWPDAIEQVMFGRCWVEERMMVHAEHQRDNQTIGVYEALNEVVVSRGQFARVIRLNTYIDGGFLTTYTADGLIVATATGSTAYALAAGGPILPPELENFLLIPLAAHLSLDRAIVLSKGVTVCAQIFTDHTAALTVDGQFEVELANADKLVMSAGDSVGRFVRLQEKNYFYRTLMHRLGYQADHH